MNRLHTGKSNANGLVVARAENTRLSGPWLIIARAVWLALVVPSLGLFVVSLPEYYRQIQEACGDITACNVNAIIPGSEYAALDTVLLVIFAAIWFGIGFLIFWRRSDDWLALLAAFVLVMFYITFPGNPPYARAFAFPALALPLNLMIFLGQSSLGVFFVFFPDGRLTPRWMGLIPLLIIVNEFLGIFPSSTSPINQVNWPAWLNLLVTIVLYGAIIYSQIYRYRRVSTSLQRQQTKWVIFGAAVVVGVVVGLLATGVFVPSIDIYFYNRLWSIALPLIPLSIGFSILRYRLYDIDLLINRTLVYGTLTALLALVYVGLVIGLQTLVHLITGQSAQSPVVIVASTLVIAALFQPLRRHIQAIIDRRFYRRKYDAARITAAFGATLRNEVELEQLREQLLVVVQETMQPSHVSLWVRQPDQTKNPLQ